MKAAICREFKAPLSIEDVEIRSPGFGELAVDMRACAICHSDILYIDGAWGGELPAVYGHEAAGVVAEVGPGVPGLAAGDHVVVTLIRACGHCASCVRGARSTCETRFPLDEKSPLTDASGVAVTQGLRTGAFAERVVVDASQVAIIPEELPFDEASLLACGVITGYGAVVNTAGVGAGEHVAVVGAGGVGLNCVQGAAIAGARSVVAIDLADVKLDAAKAFGATHGVNPSREDVGAAVRAATGGRGADWVFVAVGSGPAMEAAFALLAPGGAVVLVGMPADGVKIAFEPTVLAGAGQRVLGSKMGSARISVDIPRLVSLHRDGRLKLGELITERYPFSRINDALDAARAGAALRNVVVF